MRDLDNQIAYWDRVGPSKTFSHQVNVERLRRLLSAESRILDYGCGYGRILGVLQGEGFSNLAGFDPAPAMLAAARRDYPAIAFHDLENPPALPLEGGSADAVLLFSVLTCVPTDAGQIELIGEMNRVLRSGGLLYISDFWLQADDRNLERYARGLERYGLYGVFDLPEGVTLRHHDRRWIEALTGELEQVALDEVEVTTMNGHSARGFQWFGRKLA